MMIDLVSFRLHDLMEYKYSVKSLTIGIRRWVSFNFLIAILNILNS